MRPFSARERSQLLEVMASHPDWQTASRAFRHAVARAFAGTRWRPTGYHAWNENGLRGATLVMAIDMVDDLPLEELVPYPAFARDPRFILRGERPRRGRFRPGCKKRGRSSFLNTFMGAALGDCFAACKKRGRSSFLNIRLA